MQNIGERLEEARKRKGISLREAAEATKIRGDFLANIEQNQFDFDLPEIYKRGFLKNYARYLKLDHDKILTDYSAHQLSKSRQGRKGGAELFGTMEVKQEPPQNTQPEAPSYGTISNRSSGPAQTEQAAAEEEAENDKAFYFKAAIICVGFLALVFVIFGLIKAIMGSGDPIPAENPSATTPIVSENNLSGATVEEDNITLIASGPVLVIVKQKNDSVELYRGTMGAEEKITLSKEGPVDIVFTEGDHLVVTHNGENFRPTGSGVARISIP